MKNKERSNTKYVQLNTALLIGLSCLIIGFIGGMVYSVYGPKAEITSPAAAFNPALPSQSKVSAELSQKILELEKAAVAYPGNPETWLQLGNLYFDSDNFQNAIEAYTKYIELDPKNPNVWTDLGIMYRSAGQPEKAIETFDQAIAIDPQHEQSRYNKGVVFLHDLNDPAAAKREWEMLLRINPDFKSHTGQLLKDLIEKI
ncbi:MAG: tetratricopeptide repeat protein [Candidatus Aminicenantes bacterium]|nr:tetratricopeptide repeat protein [Candidatus Aminicenantes bacterium]